MAKVRVRAIARVKVTGAAAGSKVIGVFTADERPADPRKPAGTEAEAAVGKNGSATVKAELTLEKVDEKGAGAFWFTVTGVEQGATSYPTAGGSLPVKQVVHVATVEKPELSYEPLP